MNLFDASLTFANKMEVMDAQGLGSLSGFDIFVCVSLFGPSLYLMDCSGCYLCGDAFDKMSAVTWF